MELNRSIMNRLSESAAGGSLTSSACMRTCAPGCHTVVEDGGACSCRCVVTRRPIEVSQAITLGSSQSIVTCELGFSTPKNGPTKSGGSSPRRQSNEAARIFSLSLFGISLKPVFSDVANAAGIQSAVDPGIGEQSGRVAKKTSAVVTLASFAVTKAAYEKITKLFVAKWLEETGQQVRFRISFGNGVVMNTLANMTSMVEVDLNPDRFVMDFRSADIVSLALPLDVIKIQEAGLIDDDWQQRVPNNGVPAETTVAIVTRLDNPKQITDWPDLARSDVSVLTANPKSAGVARWNFLALWGSVIVEGGNEEEAKRFIEDIYKNVPLEPRDAREVSDVFLQQDLGDAMVTYENEIILTNKKFNGGKGEPLPYEIPQVNVRVETAMATVDRNARKNGVHEICTAFVNFCFTEPAQREYARCGFRPYLESVGAEFGFPQVARHWRVEEEIGDWNFVQDKFFADKGIVDELKDNIKGVRKLV